MPDIKNQPDLKSPPKSNPLKLKKITFDNAPRIPGVRAGDLGVIDLENPNALQGWKVVIKGAVIVLISPPGWMSGRPARDWDPQKPCLIHEIPRATCYLHWEGDETTLDQIGKNYTSEPFGKPIVVEPAPAPKNYPAPANPAEVGDE